MTTEPKVISLRRATEADAASIARLSSVLGYDAEPAVIAGRLRAILQSEADLMLVAEDSQRAVVGWLQAHTAHIVESGFRAEITGLVVSPAQRRRGVGRALVSEAERWAGSIAAEAVVVRSNVRRVESHAFYPALGYIAAKTQTVYRKTLTK
jgi:predicted N-acetyltransferase YhbS